MSILIGVDAGGTRTVAAASDGTRELGRASGRAGAVRPGRALSSAGAIAATVRAALIPAGLLRGDILVVGAAGVGRDEEQGQLRDALRLEALAERVVVTTDLAIALRDAFEGGPGIVLLAGTGSVAVARLADGSVRRQGGHGWQMGDEGSGYAIARAGLVAAGRAHDGREPPTLLLERLIDATRSHSFDDMVRWSVSAGTGEVAGLAPAVLTAAEEGDPTARGIVEGAGRDLARHAERLVEHFEGRGKIQVAFGGGLLDHTLYRQAVLDALEPVKRVTPSADRLDPVRGALAMAAEVRT
jgi:N-acetylglucosamine kinase-like BadF-type ATPase